VLRQLHWLPVQQRVDFKVIGLVFQSLPGQALVYLADDCRLVSDSDTRQLRSANIPTCEVPRSCYRFGDRSISVAALACGTLSHQHSGKLMPVLTASSDFY